MREKIYRAGFLPYKWHLGEPYFLLMKPSDPRYGGDRFQIAKGKIESGESSLEAAIREASEELGLLEENLYSTVLVGEYLGRTTVYMGEVKNPENFNTPHFETEDTAWMSLEMYETQGRELHTPVIRDAVHILVYHRTDK